MFSMVGVIYRVGWVWGMGYIMCIDLRQASSSRDYHDHVVPVG